MACTRSWDGARARGAPRPLLRAPGTEARIGRDGGRCVSRRRSWSLWPSWPPPEQAAAQTDTTFISNTGQTSTTTDTIVRATSFGTGDATYTLSSVGIYLGSIPASNITPVFRIHENGMSGSFIRPGAVVATLTNPGTFQAGAVNSFNAPASTTLSANTTYWVVTTNSAATNRTGFQVGTINSGNLDSGTAVGWTLGASRFKTDISITFWTNSSHRIRFAIRGAVANTAPTTSDSTVTTNEDTDYTFTAANFNFADTDTGDTLSSVKIVTLPGTGKGALELDGTAIASADLPKTVTKADIDASKLKYSPPANANGSAYASFTFKVNDGTDDSASANTMTIDVTAVNDPAMPTPAQAQSSTESVFDKGRFLLGNLHEGGVTRPSGTVRAFANSFKTPKDDDFVQRLRSLHLAGGTARAIRSRSTRTARGTPGPRC